MSPAPVRVLLVTDDEHAYKRLCARFEALGKYYSLDWVAGTEFLSSPPSQSSHEVYLLAQSENPNDLLKLVRAACKQGLKSPTILFKSPADGEVLSQVMAAGAGDCLEDASLDPQSLKRALDYAFLRTQFQRELESHVQERTAELVSAENTARRCSEQLLEVSRLSAHLSSVRDIPSVLRDATDAIRRIIGAHVARSALSLSSEEYQPINSVSLSESYVEDPDAVNRVGTEALDTLVARSRHVIRLSQAEVDSLPRGLCASPNMDNGMSFRGWLAAPIVTHEGQYIGQVQLTDKISGEFTETDEAVLVQWTQVAATAIDNVQLYEGMYDRDRRKDEFLAMLAHELRNPLAPIRNAVQILEFAKTDEHTVEMARQLISRQVTHLVRLVDDLLDVSRITRGKINLIKVPVDVAEIVEVAVESCRPLFQDRKHSLQVDLPNEPVRVRADLTRLAQVLLNLLNNAAKYTDEGGQIRLTVQKEENSVLIQVADNGIGISPEMLPTIFDLFTQVDRSLARSEGGLGLGLTLVRRLTEMHGGWVEASSAGPGQGSTFTLHLPVLTDDLPVQHPLAYQSLKEVPQQKVEGRILVVDDSRDSAESLATLLRARGFEVRTAYDGLQALALAAEFPSDAFILDIGLPKLDGYELARRLRKDPKSRDTLIVALTGYGTEEDRRTCFQVGFDAHFVKPVDLNALISLLASARRAVQHGGR